MPVSNDIQELVHAQFGPQAESAIYLLEQYGTDPAHGEVDRVHAAIVQLAARDLRTVERLVEEARHDYRNLLYWLRFDKDGDPPPLATFIRAEEAILTADIPSELRGAAVTLVLLEGPDYEPRVLDVNPTPEEIDAHVHQQPWDQLTFFVAQLNDNHWLEGSGSLKPEDGLSARCKIGGKEYVTSQAPQSLDEIVALLASFAQKDGRWRTMVEWG
ncbi:hypothetical protein [Blastopirellula retiformator]|uniref:Uncharacterized protein n=1 Tax=Blastopirellula retiformator TaxID=2527970 RepID=A0A5C5V499_9BACT|nr:hypothetical protein [Blastopirellula retiformator]TWT32789.1 hypothetical protein Enr8_25950 [Blastopirellula retiformator]